MAWFLSGQAGKKRGSSKKRRKKKDAWDPRRTLLGIKWIAGVAVVVGVCLAWHVGEKELQAYAERARATDAVRADRPAADRVTLVGAPAWTEGPVGQAVRALAAERAGDAAFDRAGLVAAVRAVSAQPYVERVEQIRRVPRGLEVVATYREPTALLEGAEGYYVLDAEGVWLEGPRSWHQLDRTDLPVLTAVNSPAPAARGERWQGEDVEAGLALVRLARSQPWVGQIESFDVGHRDPHSGKPILVMHTDLGRVVWGRSIGEGWSVSEVSTDQKLERLAWLMEEHHGRVDAGGRTVLLAGERLLFDPTPMFADEPRQGVARRRTWADAEARGTGAGLGAGAPVIEPSYSAESYTAGR